MNNDKGQLLFRAKQAGAVRDIAIARGGTGELRKELSSAEKKARKAKRNRARASRQFNRKAAK